MTSSNTPPEEDSLEVSNTEPRSVWLRRTIAVLGLTLAGIGAVGYVSINHWISKELPPFLETELSKILKRQVNIGKVKSWSLTGIQIGSSSIPATVTDPDSVDIKAINVNFAPIPTLLSRTLVVSVTLVKPNVYIAQDKQGEWVNPDILQQPEGGKLPINLNATVRLQSAKVVLLPQGQKTALSTQINGFVNYNQTQPERVKYDINADIAEGQLSIKGKTEIKTGQTQAITKVEKLDLAKFNDFIPDKIVALSQGRLNANLQVNLPSFSQMPVVKGRANIKKIQAKIKQLPLPIKANTSLKFVGQQVIFEDTKGSYGNLTTLISGNVDLNQGLNLKVDTNPVDLATLVRTLPVKLPVNIDGKLQAQMFLRGALTNPVILGSLVSKQKIKVDQTEFSALQAKFAGNTNKILLQDLRVTPAAGGEITAKGNVKFIDRQTGKINFNQAKLAFDLDANLPNISAIVADYGVDSQLVKLGRMKAEGKISGTLQNPQGTISWNLANANVSSLGKVSAAGDILLRNRQITLQNIALETESGQVKIRGIGDLKQQNWQALISTNYLPLNAAIANLKIGEYAINEPIILKDSKIQLAGRLDDFNLANIQANSNLKLDITKGNILVNTQVNRGIIQANATAKQVNIQQLLPSLPLPLKIVNSQANISGSLQQLLSFGSDTNLDSFRGTASGQLVNAQSQEKGIVNFNAKGDLANKSWQANLKANDLPLNTFISQLQLDNLQINQPVTLQRGDVNLVGKLDNFDLESIQGVAKANLNVSNGNVVVNSRLTQGTIQAQAIAQKIALAKLIPGLPLPVNLVNSRVNLSSSTEQLLKLDLSQMQANAVAKLAVAQGTVNTRTQLNNGKFSTNINTNDINPPVICSSISLSCPQLTNLSTKISLMGDIDPLLQGKSPTTIQAKTVSLQTGKQSLNANGKVTLTPVSGKIIPWSVETDLNIVANSDLEQLPLTLALPGEPSDIPVAGKARFNGRFIGKDVLSSPFSSGNLQLVGDLQLRDFVVENIAFQPLLKGPLKIDLGREIAIDLQGEQDTPTEPLRERIAAKLEPCQQKKCLLPYLPVSFELKQGSSQTGIILSGKRQGDNLDVQIKNLSLGLLNTIPIVQQNIPGSVRGIATGEVEVNLFNLATTGNIQVTSPDLGYIKAKEIAANFSYDGELAKLSSASLQLGESQYDFQGSLNLNSGDINGRMVTNSAQLQDIFAAVDLPLIEALFTNTKASDYGNASDVQTQPVGNPQATIFAQLRLLSQIRNQLQQLTAKERQPIQFNPANIRGNYSTEINIAGKLTNPEVNFQLDGKNWQWQEQQPTVTIKSSDFPVETTNKELQIDRIIAKASFNNGVLQLEPLRVNIEDSFLAFQGQLALKQASGLLKVENFPINTVQRFIDLPVDIGGRLNLQANLNGSLFNPQIPQGKLSLVNGTLEQESIGKFAGQFSYLDSRLTFNTTSNSSIQLQALVPYPPQEGENNSLLIDTKFGTKLFALLKPLTQGQLEWVKGDGKVEFKIAGPLNWQAKTAPEFLKNTTATSNIQIENATVKTKQLGEDIDLNVAGNLTLDNETIQVEKLAGNLAGSPFSVMGILPLFEPTQELSNPLTLTLGPGKLDIKGLYNGKIDGNVIISETATNPVIGGKLHIHDGRVLLPKGSKEDVATQTQPSTNYGKNIAQSNNQTFGILPRFQDFQVIVGNRFKFKRSLPQINMSLAGKLILNGLWNELQPQGTIELQRGRINLLDNQFVLTRTHDQIIEFIPEQGLFNPNISIQLQTLISDVSPFERRQPIDAEIRDDIVAPPNPNRIDVRVTIEGNGNQLLSNLFNTSTDTCRLNQANTIPNATVETGSQLDPQALQTVANCIHHNTEVGIQQKQWLINPAIKLTSTPQRNQAEIMALLGNRAINSMLEIQKKISEGNGTDLISSGVIQYLTDNVITNTEQEIFWKIQQPFDAFGKKIGLTHFQVIPSVQGVKHIDANSSLRFVYDYSNFFYQSLFLGKQDGGFDSQFRVMYERRF